MPTGVAEKPKVLKRETREPRQAHEIMRKAVARWAQLELDRPVSRQTRNGSLPPGSHVEAERCQLRQQDVETGRPDGQ